MAIVPDAERDREIVRKTEAYVKQQMSADCTGHDWWHVDRVRRSAVALSALEGADDFVVELAALLHDIGDAKFSGSEEVGAQMVGDWLESIGAEPSVRDEVTYIVRHLSFRGAVVAQVPLSLEGRCVQDADRLDALGAIGIARTFAYGGFVGRPIHEPEVMPVLHDSVEGYRSSVGTTINHFHEKLLLLKDRMNTTSGRRAAKQRHDILLSFLAQFDAEWCGSLPPAETVQ